MIALTLAAILVCSSAMACPQEVPDEDRAIVEGVVRDCNGWALTKDRARLESIVAHDADFFIFHPDWEGTVVGWDEFVKLFDSWMDPRFKATSSDLRDLRINFSRGGDVAWFSGILDDCYEWDGRPGCWKDTRWTGVVEKRDGAWVLVQMHFSFAYDRAPAPAAASDSETAESDPSQE